jgi:hypothetical protein
MGFGSNFVLKIKGSSNFGSNMQNIKIFTMNFIQKLFQEKKIITKF